MSSIKKIQIDNDIYEIEDERITNEQIGTTQIDLSQYALKEDVPITLGQLINDVGYISEETDPTVPDFVKSITEEDIAKWNNLSSAIEINEETIKCENLEDGIYKVNQITLTITYGTKNRTLVFLQNGQQFEVKQNNNKNTWSIFVQENEGNKANFTAYFVNSSGDAYHTSLKADSTHNGDVLTTYNNEYYNVGNDYTPAHKKYVDDSIISALENIGGGNGITKWTENTFTPYNMPAGIYQFAQDTTVLFRANSSYGDTYKSGDLIFVGVRNGSAVPCFAMNTTNFGDFFVKFCRLTSSGNSYVNLFLDRNVTYGGNRILLSDITYSPTQFALFSSDPTDDNQVARKKYVDDSIKSAIGDALGGEY